MRTVLDTVDEMRNDFIAKQNEKAEKDKESKDHFRKVEDSSIRDSDVGSKIR